ncbi:unnamed protein product [Cylicocyclus nassatus]|uniref:Uncharacterized protein n=1 Tax=Cylicocyclus nassatus TaxID=53992 RepID=A0AA36GJ52_CYLNA|nr:unnamed protein product [Cylicocyclus nassatus]
MVLFLLFLVFIPLTIAATNKNDEMMNLFCSKGCPYLKSMDKNAKISFKRLNKKCKEDPKIPKFLCGKTPDQNTAKLLERHTWAQLCKAACGNLFAQGAQLNYTHRRGLASLHLRNKILKRGRDADDAFISRVVVDFDVQGFY